MVESKTELQDLVSGGWAWGGNAGGQGRRSGESCEGPEEGGKPEPVPLAIAVWRIL